MKKILVTGAKGQLAYQLKKIVGDYANYLFLSKEYLDITDLQSVKTCFQTNAIELVVNCAGFTQVEEAETNSQKAWLVNVLGVENLIALCKQYNVPLLQISTDYVFDGSQRTPYTETDIPSPINQYGQSKYQAECLLLNSGLKHFIIRTSWLYSDYGTNFVKRILEIAQNKRELQVVDDQIGSPTSAIDLARFIHFIIRNKIYDSHSGIYHFANLQACSWFDLAVKTIELFSIKARVIPCSTNQLYLKAHRPLYSVLSKDKIINELGYSVANWEDALKEVIDILKK